MRKLIVFIISSIQYFCQREVVFHRKLKSEAQDDADKKKDKEQTV